MPENEIDQLSISVKASATDAANGIDRVAEALGKLGDKAAGVDYSSLRNLSDNLKSLAELKLSGVGTTINAIAKLSKNVHELESLRNIDPTIFDNLAEGLKSLSGIKISGIGTVLAEVRKLPETFENLDSIVVEEYAAHLQELVDALTPIAEKANEVTSAFQTMSKINVKASLKGVEKNTAAETEKATINYAQLGRTLSALAKPLSKAADGFKRLVKNMASKVVSAFTDRIKGALRGVERLFATLRRIIFTRAIRAALRAITAGIKEGIDNLYQWSALVDGRFKASLDKIATSLLYLKNSIAAMVSPIINKLAPAIDWLVDRFVDLLNIVNQVFSALTGSNTWTKAIKYPVEYAEGMADAAKSTKEAAKELKLFLLPFDELNVLTKDNPADTSTPGGAGQGGLNYAEMFETRELEDWAKKIKDLIDQGDWYGAGAALAEHLNGIIERWDSEAWGKELAAKLNNGIQFALGLMRNFGWELLGDKVGGFLNGFTLDFDWESFGALLATPVNSVSAFLKGMFKRFNGTEFGKGLGKLFNGWVKEMNVQDIIDAFELGVEDATQIISSFFDTVDVDELAQKIADLLTGCDWENIMSQVWDVAKKAIGTTWKLGATLVENLWNGYETDENGNKISNPEKAKYGKGIVLGGATLGAGALSAGVIGKILGVVGKALPFLSKLFSGSGSGALSGILKVLGPAEGAVVGKGTILTQGLLSSPLSALGALIAPALPYVGTAAGVGMFAAGQASAAKNGTSVGNVLARMYGGAAAGASAGSVAGPLGALVGTGIGLTAGIETSAITAVVEFVTKNWEKIKEAAQPVIDWITTAWGDMTDWISEKWTLVSDWLSEKWTAISTWVDENVIQPVKAVIDPIVEWIKTLLEGIRIIFDAFLQFSATLVDTLFVQPAIRHWNNFVENVNKLIEWFKTTKFYKFIENLVAAFKKGVENLKTAWRVGWEAISKIVSVVWTSIKAGFAAAWAYIKSSFITPLWNAMSSLGKAIVSAFKTAFYTVEWIGASVVNALLAKVEGAINAIIDGLNFFVGIFNRIVEAAAMYTGASWSGLGEIGHVSLGRIDTSSISNNMANSAMDTGYYAADALSNIGGGVGDMFGDMADAIRGSGRERSQQIDVTVELDGEKVGRSVVNYVNDQTIANGQSPMYAY